MRYFITGHTGFKGSWLTAMLSEQGHTVSGLALDPEPRSLYAMADIAELVEHDIRADVRDPTAVRDALALSEPDVLIHLAAQPLVRESYRDPRYTVETNVMGTLNVLEAASATPSLRAQLIVTTDKVYRNVNREAGYVEEEPLGGDDPYSASKTMADVLTHAWTTSFPTCPTAIARAGNVIGGGDYSKDRLIPDLMDALVNDSPLTLRYPNAVRPWQHVLDCLTGYVAVIGHLLDDSEPVSFGAAWNVGPGRDSFRTVEDVSRAVADIWGVPVRLDLSTEAEPHEAGLLALDSSKASSVLGWRNRLDLHDTLTWTVDWYKSAIAGGSARGVTIRQVRDYLEFH